MSLSGLSGKMLTKAKGKKRTSKHSIEKLSLYNVDFISNHPVWNNEEERRRGLTQSCTSIPSPISSLNTIEFSIPRA